MFFSSPTPSPPPSSMPMSPPPSLELWTSPKHARRSLSMPLPSRKRSCPSPLHTRPMTTPAVQLPSPLHTQSGAGTLCQLPSPLAAGERGASSPLPSLILTKPTTNVLSHLILSPKVQVAWDNLRLQSPRAPLANTPTTPGSESPSHQDTIVPPFSLCFDMLQMTRNHVRVRKGDSDVPTSQLCMKPDGRTGAPCLELLVNAREENGTYVCCRCGGQCGDSPVIKKSEVWRDHTALKKAGASKSFFGCPREMVASYSMELLALDRTEHKIRTFDWDAGEPLPAGVKSVTTKQKKKKTVAATARRKSPATKPKASKKTRKPSTVRKPRPRKPLVETAQGKKKLVQIETRRDAIMDQLREHRAINEREDKVGRSGRADERDSSQRQKMIMGIFARMSEDDQTSRTRCFEEHRSCLAQTYRAMGKKANIGLVRRSEWLGPAENGAGPCAQASSSSSSACFRFERWLPVRPAVLASAVNIFYAIRFCPEDAPTLTAAQARVWCFWAACLQESVAISPRALRQRFPTAHAAFASDQAASQGWRDGLALAELRSYSLRPVLRVLALQFLASYLRAGMDRDVAARSSQTTPNPSDCKWACMFEDARQRLAALDLETGQSQAPGLFAQYARSWMDPVGQILVELCTTEALTAEKRYGRQVVAWCLRLSAAAKTARPLKHLVAESSPSTTP